MLGQCWLRLEATPDRSGDQAVMLQQCSCRGGVCCSSAAPALAGLEGFPSIVAGAAERCGAPGFPRQSAPGGPRSHLCGSRCHHPLQQGKAGSSSCPFGSLPLLATAPSFLPGSHTVPLAALPSSRARVLDCSGAPQLLSYRQLCCGHIGGSFVVPGFGSRAEQRWGCLVFLPSGQKGSQG